MQKGNGSGWHAEATGVIWKSLKFKTRRLQGTHYENVARQTDTQTTATTIKGEREQEKLQAPKAISHWAKYND